MDRELRPLTIFALTAFLAIFFLPLLPSHAISQSILINEILYDPEGTDSGNEWLEIQNVSNQSINLLGWTIQTAGSSFQTAATLPDYTITPGDIVLIGEPSVDTADITIPSLSMQNGGTATDGVRILNAEYTVIDTVLYDEPNTNALPSDSSTPGTSCAQDAPSGSSLARTSETDQSNTDFAVCDQPTPGQPNIFPPTASFDKPEEIVTNQETHFTSTSTDPDNNIEETTWIIENETYYSDFTGEEITYSFPEPGTYSITLEVTDSGHLSDTYDTSVEVGQNPEDPATKSIADVKNLEKGTTVYVLGTVTLAPDTAISQEGYIQDTSAGIRIRQNPEYPMSQDTTYLISGTISSTDGEPKINITTAVKHAEQLSIRPTLIPSTTLSSEHEGLLIQTTILVTSTRSPYFYGETNSSGITPSIYLSDDIDSDIIQKDSPVTIIGVLSRYGTTDQDLPKLRIIPRTITDISNASAINSLTNTGFSVLMPLVLGMALLLITRTLRNLACTTQTRQ